MNELKSKGAAVKEYFNKIVIGSAVLLVLILVIQFIRLSGYSAFNEDETIYYIGAKLFAEANSVKAHGIISENVSPIFEADWYGIFYPIYPRKRAAKARRPDLGLGRWLERLPNVVYS